MDQRKNPFAPGAGTPPPELAGREGIIEDVSIGLDRIKNGRSAKSVLMVGLRGVGKTVLLNRLKDNAESSGLVCASFEAKESQSLPSMLIPQLRISIMQLDRIANMTSKIKSAYGALGSFIAGIKMVYNDVEFNYDITPDKGVSDSGDLDLDLSELMVKIGEAAREKNTAVVLFIDEMQYIPTKELSALISALHICSQKKLPITVVGAGLPQLVGNAGAAKSYSERLFDFPDISKLDKKAAAEAITIPVEAEGVSFTDEAVAEIVRKTEGYPYFLQEWGSHSWSVAQNSPITLTDVQTASELAIAKMDASFFRVRYDRCTPMEKSYMRAMAEIRDATPRSGDIAAIMKKNVNQLGPLRQSLIKKGMVYSPAHGDTAFTVPMFAEYMKRTMDLI